MEWVVECARSRGAHPVEIGEGMVSALGRSKDGILKSLKKCSTLVEGVDYVQTAGTTYLSKAAFADILKITAYVGKERQKATAVRVFKEFEKVWKEEEGSLHGKRKDRGEQSRKQEEAPKKRRIEKVMDDAQELNSICQQGVEHCKAFISTLRNQVGVAKKIARRGEHVLEDFLKLFNIDEGAFEDQGFDEEEETVELSEGVQDANVDRQSFRKEHTATEKVGEDMGGTAGGKGEEACGKEGAEETPVAEKAAEVTPVAEKAGGEGAEETPIAEEAGGEGAETIPVAEEAEGEGAVKTPFAENAGGEGAEKTPIAEKAGGEGAEKIPVAEEAGEDGAEKTPVAEEGRVGEEGNNAEETGDSMDIGAEGQARESTEKGEIRVDGAGKSAGDELGSGGQAHEGARENPEKGEARDNMVDLNVPAQEEAGDSPTIAVSPPLAMIARPGTSDKGTAPMERVVGKRVMISVGPIEAYVAEIHRMIARRQAESAAAERARRASAFTRWSPRAGCS